MIGERLKIIRESLNLNQTTFADSFSIGQKTYSNYENEKRKISVEFQNVLIEQYGININWLLTGKGSMFLIDASEELKLLQEENNRLKEDIKIVTAILGKYS